MAWGEESLNFTKDWPKFCRRCGGRAFHETGGGATNGRCQNFCIMCGTFEEIFGLEGCPKACPALPERARYIRLRRALRAEAQANPAKKGRPSRAAIEARERRIEELGNV